MSGENNRGPEVGRRIREIREKRGLSLRALARESGLSVNAISLIERGENSPTVASLHHLAGALDSPITDFFRDQSDRTTVIVRSTERPTFNRDGIVMESLGSGLRDQQIEPFVIRVLPGHFLEKPVVHPGQEMVYVLNGSVEYEIAEQTHLLDVGDSLLLDSTQPHCFRNHTDEPVSLVVVFCTADAYGMGRERHLER